MKYYEIWPADSHYKADKPLIYSYDGELLAGCVVTVTIRNRAVSGFVKTQTAKPGFDVKPIKSILSLQPIPRSHIQLADWLSQYYVCPLGDSLRQLAPPKPSINKIKNYEAPETTTNILDLNSPLTKDQEDAINAIKASKSTSVILHGDTGTGKTRVYLELAKECLTNGQSVVILTPEISLTAQLAKAVSQLPAPLHIFHSGLGVAARKKIWLSILESERPVIVVGPRSALFNPINNLGLIVVDEAHEPAYKQDSIPRYQISRVASQLGQLTGAKVIFGSATPTVSDYYLAQQKDAIVTMTQPAIKSRFSDTQLEVVDIKDRNNFGRSQHISKNLIDGISDVLASKRQAMIYLNRRGSARIILCNQCGWQLLCPNCDVPLIYHADKHETRCHICGYHQNPPQQCPQCSNQDIVYKSIGVKALEDELARLFPDAVIKRFDSDNAKGQHLNDLYPDLVSGKIDILVGTQLLAKGLDLPKLGLVGIIAAESSLTLPDYNSQERSFQLLYQVLGRVGRGHNAGRAIIQTYEPDSIVVKASLKRSYQLFYEHCLRSRQAFKFPPYSYLLKMTCSRASSQAAHKAASELMSKLAAAKKPVELIGPTASFYSRRGNKYFWQIVIKSKDRTILTDLAATAPNDWTKDLDPNNLL